MCVSIIPCKTNKHFYIYIYKCRECFSSFFSSSSSELASSFSLFNMATVNEDGDQEDRNGDDSDSEFGPNAVKPVSIVMRLLVYSNIPFGLSIITSPLWILCGSIRLFLCLLIGSLAYFVSVIAAYITLHLACAPLLLAKSATNKTVSVQPCHCCPSILRRIQRSELLARMLNFKINSYGRCVHAKWAIVVFFISSASLYFIFIGSAAILLFLIVTAERTVL